MRSEDESKIRKQMVYITDNLEVNEKFLDYLDEKDLFTKTKLEHFTELLKIKTQKDVRRELLSFLTRSGPKAYKAFLDALWFTEQGHIALKIDSEYKPSEDQYKPGSYTEGDIENQPNPNYVENQAEGDKPDIKIDIMKMNENGPCCRKLLADKDSFYHMKHKIRGRAVIINMMNFSGAATRRHNVEMRGGSQYDTRNMKELLRNLGYVVHDDDPRNHDRTVYQDAKWEDLNKDLDKEAQHPAHRDADAFIMVIMSHGMREHFFDYDGNAVHFNSVISKFSDYKCPALRGKPKLFIIQACQGNKINTGVAVADNMEADTTPLEFSPSAAATLDRVTDTIAAYSTVADFLSYRETTKGTWFIRELVEQVCLNAHRHHVEQILTNVCQKLNAKETKGTSRSKQINNTKTYNLSKHFYLLPGVTLP